MYPTLKFNGKSYLFFRDLLKAAKEYFENNPNGLDRKWGQIDNYTAVFFHADGKYWIYSSSKMLSRILERYAKSLNLEFTQLSEQDSILYF